MPAPTLLLPLKLPLKIIRHTVDDDGTVMALSTGTATVKATVTGYESVCATWEITVTKVLLLPPGGMYFVFHETFENAAEGSLLSAANGTDEVGYVIGGGGSATTISGGALTMTGSRWKTRTMDLTGEDVTLLVKVRQNAATADAAKRFQLALDIEGSSGVNNLCEYLILNDLPAPDAAFQILSIPITSGTESSFIHFRTESASGVDIDEIAIYKKVGPDDLGSGGDDPGEGGDDPATSVAIETYGLKLYPNPVRADLNVSLDQEIAAVELVNIMGSKVLSRKLQGAAAYTLNLQSVAAGKYVAFRRCAQSEAMAGCLIFQPLCWVVERKVGSYSPSFRSVSRHTSG
jgi:hypothetical protein